MLLLASIESSIRSTAEKCNRCCECIQKDVASAWENMSQTNLILPRDRSPVKYDVDSIEQTLNRCFALRSENDCIPNERIIGCVTVDCRSIKRRLDLEATRRIHECSVVVGNMISRGVRELTDILEGALPLMRLEIDVNDREYDDAEAVAAVAAKEQSIKMVRANVNRFPRIVGEVERLSGMLHKRDIPFQTGQVRAPLGNAGEQWAEVVTEAFRYEDRRGHYAEGVQLVASKR